MALVNGWRLITLKMPSGKEVFLFLSVELFKKQNAHHFRSPDGTTIITNSADNHLRSFILYVSLYR